MLELSVTKLPFPILLSFHHYKTSPAQFLCYSHLTRIWCWRFCFSFVWFSFSPPPPPHPSCLSLWFLLTPSACPDGKFGENCLRKCRCHGNACNAESGKCVCEAGRMGRRCRKSECLCSAFNFGFNQRFPAFGAFSHITPYNIDYIWRPTSCWSQEWPLISGCFDSIAVYGYCTLSS